jgi:hypothetical protein
VLYAHVPLVSWLLVCCCAVLFAGVRVGVLVCWLLQLITMIIFEIATKQAR